MSESSHLLDGIRGLLLDVDGTLLSGDRPIEGAVEAVRTLRARGLHCRMITNTTRRSRNEQARVLNDRGFEIDVGEVLMPAALARRLILASGLTRAALLVPTEALADFEGITPDESEPDFVVLADQGDDFDWQRLNSAFRCLMKGARLLALQRNPYWYSNERGLVLDTGALVAALEFAAGVEAEVVGKPSPRFFELAIDDIGLPPEQILVVGDDLTNDVAGGHAAGCRTALVRTGNFRDERIPADAPTRPDAILDSIADLP